LFLGENPKLYKFWGEMLQAACTCRDTISFDKAVLISENEDDIDRILKDEWQKIRNKTTTLPITFVKKIT
jgi:hypothetical protein